MQQAVLDFCANLLPRMLGGLGMTLSLFVLTLLFALPLGLLVALGRMSRFRIVRWVVGLFITAVRGTPLMLQIVLVYFLPYYLFGTRFGRFVMAVVALVINYSAYFAEIYRGGIQSIPQGQYEAGKVLGFTRTQVFLKIVLPQVIKRILPPISNEIITLVKDTALVQIIGIMEMFNIAQGEMVRVASLYPLLIAGVFYLIMNSVIAKLLNLFEKKLNYYK